MNALEALLEAVAMQEDPTEVAAFDSMTDEYERLVGQEVYESTNLLAYRFFLAGRLFQEAQDAEEGVGVISVELTPIQAKHMIQGLLSGVVGE